MSDRAGLARFAAGVLLSLLGAYGSGAGAGEPPVRDPTRPPTAAAEGFAKRAPDGGLHLYLTTVSGDNRSAVINDDIVRVGSLVDGAVVTAIEQGRVTLKRGSEVIVLQLFTLPVKRPAGDSS